MSGRFEGIAASAVGVPSWHPASIFRPRGARPCKRTSLLTSLRLRFAALRAWPGIRAGPGPNPGTPAAVGDVAALPPNRAGRPLLAARNLAGKAPQLPPAIAFIARAKPFAPAAAHRRGG